MIIIHNILCPPFNYQQLISQASKLNSDSDVEIVNGDEEMESEEDD